MAKFDSVMAYCFLVENVNQKSFAKIHFLHVFFFFLFIPKEREVLFLLSIFQFLIESIIVHCYVFCMRKLDMYLLIRKRRLSCNHSNVGWFLFILGLWKSAQCRTCKWQTHPSREIVNVLMIEIVMYLLQLVLVSRMLKQHTPSVMYSCKFWCKSCTISSFYTLCCALDLVAGLLSTCSHEWLKHTSAQCIIHTFFSVVNYIKKRSRVCYSAFFDES